MARSSFLGPGFRFHPTDVELVMYYLKKKLLGKKLIVEALAEVNIYDFSPWDLPDKSNLRSGDLEWFFFCPKARKYLSGSRSNRATETGFWKATGKDRPVVYKKRKVAMIKTLVFHLGHAPNGERTDWVMHEYRMDDQNLNDLGVVQDTYVVCKIFKKSGAGPKNGAQYGAPFNEEEWEEPLTEPGSSLTEPGSSLTEPGLSLPEPGSSVTELGSSITEPGLSLPEAGSSTVMFSANETHIDVPAVDDGMLTAEEIAKIMGIIGDSNDKEEQVKRRDDGIYDDLANLINLDDLGESEAMFKIDYALDNSFLKADDLDAHLKGFYVD